MEEMVLSPYVVLFVVVLPLSLFFYASAFVRRSIIQLVCIALEKIWWPSGFPRLGKNGARDVSDAKWLSRALCKKYPDTLVGSVSAKSMGHDMGNASTMFRLKIDYKHNPHDLPDVMIVKLPKDSLANRIPFNVTRMNEMEVQFYATKLSEELSLKGIQVPRGFGGAYNTYGGQCYAIMEDITASVQKAHFSNEREPITSMHEARDVVRSIAALHGQFFEARERFAEEGDLSWVVNGKDPVYTMMPVFFSAGWDMFVKRFGDRIHEDIVKRGKMLIPVSQQLYDFMTLSPVTVVHGDCHLNNSYFTYSGKSRRLGFYDFQLLQQGKGAMDLATFMGGSFSPELLGGGSMNNDGEISLLQTYLEELEKTVGHKLEFVDSLGRTQLYDLDALYIDYKMALALVFGLNVAASLAVPFNTDAHIDYEAYCTRLVSNIHRTSAINFALWYLTVPGVSTALGLRGKKLEFGGTSVAPIQRCIPGRSTNVAFNVMVEEAKITPDEPKSIFEKYVYRPLMYRFLFRRTSSRAGYHGQKTTDVPIEELEGHHSVTFAQGTPMRDHAFDSFYLSAFSKDCPSFALRWCRRFGEHEGELWLVIKMSGQDGSIWTSLEHPSTRCTALEDGDDTVVVRTKDGSVMSFTCIVPMKNWRADFDGLLKNWETGEVRRASFSLETSGVMDRFAFGTHVSPHLAAESLVREALSKKFFDELQSSHQEHYEQFSHVKGQFHLGGEYFDVKAKGMRDRAFGVREWGYLQRYIALYFWADPMQGGKSITLILASLPTMTSIKFGFVCERDGEDAHQINAMSGNLAEIGNDGVPPQEWELAFRSNDKYYIVRCFALPDDSVGLNMKDAMWINLRFTTFQLYEFNPATMECKSYTGFGASEFGYRFKGYQPYRPTFKLSAPTRAKMA